MQSIFAEVQKWFSFVLKEVEESETETGSFIRIVENVV